MCGVLWGVGGTLAFLGVAIVRLLGRVSDMFRQPLHWYHWVTFLLVVLFMAYSEGYRGFQHAFAPRVAARAKYLYHSPRLLHVVLAPVFCMGYFHIQPRRQRAIVVLTAGIVLLVVVLRFLAQPWRGMVDAGVVVGLTWGMVSIACYSIYAFTARDFRHSPEVPQAALACACPAGGKTTR
jgi:hypothetical protein